MRLTVPVASVFSFRPRRWLVHLALAFGAGVFLGLHVSFSFLWPAGAALCIVWIVLLRREGYSLYLPCMALAVMLGLLRCIPAAQPVLPPEGTYTITAEVTGECSLRETDGRAAVYLKDVRLEGISGVYRLYWTWWPDQDAKLPLDGQRVCFTGKVYHPMLQQNPHGFDFRLYLLQKGVTLGVSGCGGLTLSPEEQAVHRSPILRLRLELRKRLDLLLGDTYGPLASALLLGDKSDLPEELASDFRLSGTAHVLAVSGLHVMILFSCILYLLRRFSPSQLMLTLVSLLLLGVYAALTGMKAPVLRAGLLLMYSQAGRVARRSRDRLTALAAAFWLILVIRPLELFSAGFQMSFGAVLGLTLLGDRADRLLDRIPMKWVRYLLGAWSAALCGMLGTAVPVIWYYHRLSWMGLLISPLAVALVTLLLPLSVLVLAAGFVWMPAGQVIGAAAKSVFCLLAGTVRLAASVPFGNVLLPRPPFYMIAALALCMVLCTRYVLMSPRRRMILGGGAAALSVLLLILTRSRDVRYIQFSEGSADAAVIEDGNYTYVIDTSDNGRDLADYLLSEGRRADVLILTHLHTDHALGLRELLDQGVPIGRICISSEALVTPVAESCLRVLEQAEDRGVPVCELSAGDVLATGRVTLKVLWPERGGANPLADANDFAMALGIDLDGVSMLHMSDVTGTYEMRSAVPSQLLKAAHHGSASSTGERFLRQVQPQVALLSTRSASSSVLNRLAEAGVIVYDTSERGALILSAREGSLRIRGYLR